MRLYLINAHLLSKYPPVPPHVSLKSLPFETLSSLPPQLFDGIRRFELGPFLSNFALVGWFTFSPLFWDDDSK